MSPRTADDAVERGRAILERMVAVDFPGSRALRAQLRHATLTSIVDDPPSLTITIAGDCEFAEVTSRVPVEAVGEDLDGGVIHFLLHVIDGQMCELEILREDGEAIVALPIGESVKVY